MAAPPLEIKGKSYPLTILSPVPVWKRWILFLVLHIFRRLPLNTVKNLMFIHFATWQPVNRSKFPRLSPEQPPEELSDDYFMFTTNFNGTWDQYIDAFGLIKGVRHGLNFLWSTSRGYPGAWPIRPFKRYIHYYEYPLDLYYNAYPGMSVREIRNATELSAELDEFIRQTGAYDSAERFREDFTEFLDRVAWRLADTGGEGEKSELPSSFHARPHGLQV